MMDSLKKRGGIFVKEPTSVVIDVSDDDVAEHSKDEDGVRHAPPEPSSAPASQVASVRARPVHDAFHSRMERHLSRNNHHHSVPGLVVSKEAVKTRVTMYLLLDSDSDYDDVEFLEQPKESSSSAKDSRSSKSAGSGVETKPIRGKNKKTPASEVAEAPTHNTGSGSNETGGTASKNIPETLDLEVDEVDETEKFLHIETGKLVCRKTQKKGTKNITRDCTEQEKQRRSNHQGSKSQKEVLASRGFETDGEESLELEVEEWNDLEESADGGESVEDDEHDDTTELEFVRESNNSMAKISGQDLMDSDLDKNTGICLGISGKMSKQKQQNKQISCVNKVLGKKGKPCRDMMGQKDRIQVNTGIDRITSESECSIAGLCGRKESRATHHEVCAKTRELEEESRPGQSCEFSESDPRHSGTGQGMSGQKRTSSDRGPHAAAPQPPRKSRRIRSSNGDKASKVIKAKLPATLTFKEKSPRPSNAAAPQSRTQSISTQPESSFQSRQSLKPMMLVMSSQQGVTCSIHLQNQLGSVQDSKLYSDPVAAARSNLNNPKAGLEARLESGSARESFQGLCAKPADSSATHISGGTEDTCTADEETIKEEDAADHTPVCFECGTATSATDLEMGSPELVITDVFHMTDETYESLGHVTDRPSVTFSTQLSTLQDADFQRCLQETQPSQKLLTFLLDAQDIKFMVCPACEDTVLTHPVFLWGKTDITVSNVSGVLMVTMHELARIGLIDYHIANYHLMNKQAYPAVWSFVQERGSKRCVDGVSLVFVLYVIDELLHTEVPQGTTRRLQQILRAPFHLVGQQHTAEHSSFTRNSSDSHLEAKQYNYKCSDVTRRLVKAKQQMLMLSSTQVKAGSSSQEDSVGTLLDTNASVCREPEELAFSLAWDRILNQQHKQSEEHGFSRSLHLMYPPCACQEMSKMDLIERASWRTIEKTPGGQTMQNLGVIRFMGRNVFCFLESGWLYVSVAEMKERSLLPEDYGTVMTEPLLGRLYSSGDVRHIKKKETDFLSQFFEGFAEESAPHLQHVVTPFGLREIYLRLSRSDYQFSRHSKAIYYMMTLGHHCAWTLQVTPPTSQLHKVPGYERPDGKEQPAAMILGCVDQTDLATASTSAPQKWRIGAYFDGGGGTPPAAKYVTESLNTALQQTIRSFDLQSIAEPFCQCDINATDLHMYRFLTFQDVKLNHVTQMVFEDKLLHCWKRNNGFFVSCDELFIKELLPSPYPTATMEELRRQPASFQSLSGNEEIFLPTLPPTAASWTVCGEHKKLINLKVLRQVYEAFPAQGLAKHRFRIKLWPHSCPAEEGERCELENAGSAAGAQDVSGETLHQESGGVRTVLESPDADFVVNLVDDSDDDVCLGSQAMDSAAHASEKGAVSTGAPAHQTCPGGIVTRQRTRKKLADAQDTSRMMQANLSTTDENIETRTNVLRNQASRQALDKEVAARTDVSNQPRQWTADREVDARTSLSGNSLSQQRADREKEAHGNAHRDPENLEASASLSYPRKKAGEESANIHSEKVVRPTTSIQPKRAMHTVSSDCCAADILKGTHQLHGSRLLRRPLLVKFQSACMCPDRKPGLFPSFSFLQCTYSADSRFTIHEHVGQAIINRKLFFCFYKLKQVFFSITDVTCTGDAIFRFPQNFPGLFSKDNQMSEEEQLLISEFRGLPTKLRGNGDQLISSSTLLRLISRSKGSLEGGVIYLHQVGHICPSPDSLAHSVQAEDSNMQHVQSAWMRAFQWHKEFQLLQAAACRDPANGGTSARKATNRCNRLSAECSDADVSPRAAEARGREGVVCVRAVVNGCDARGSYGVSEQACEFTSISPISLQVLAIKQDPDIKRESYWEDPSTSAEPHHCAGVKRERCDCSDVKHEAGEEDSELGAAQSIDPLQEVPPKHVSVCLAFNAQETVPTVCQDPREVDQNGLEDASPVEGVVLVPHYKVTVLHNEERLKQLLGDQGPLYDIVLTGVLTCSNCRYMCLSVRGQLYINWGEVVELLASPEDREIVFKQARRLHAFLYQPPLYLNELLSRRYGGDLDTLNSAPWVVVNTLVAIYNLGSGMLDREKMLKRFVDVTPDSVCLPMFLLIRK